MNTYIKNLFRLLALTAGLNVILPSRVTAQIYTTLYSFTALDGHYTNSDGTTPYAGLILAGSTLYGMAALGGSSDAGTVFAVKTDGTGFTNLHIFAVLSPSWINSDGVYPHAGLILSGNTLYGTASRGGSSGNGTVFAVNTDGMAFTNLHTLTPTGLIRMPE